MRPQPTQGCNRRCANSSSSASSDCSPSSSTARSAWGTASRRPRSWSRPASRRPRPRRPSTSPRSAPRWSPGFSHHKLGNTDWRTVGVLALPGFVGAFAGATLLVNLDADIAVPWSPASCSRSASTSSGASSSSAAPPTLQVPAGRAVPRPAGPLRRRARRDRRRRLGPGRHHDAARLGPARAAQGRRLGRHRGVRGRRRRLARLPRRAGLAGHRVGLRRRADRRRRDRRPDRRLAGQEARRPGARRRGRRPDRAHQLQTIAEALGASGAQVAASLAVVVVLWISGIVWAVRQERRARGWPTTPTGPDRSWSPLDSAPGRH